MVVDATVDQADGHQKGKAELCGIRRFGPQLVRERLADQRQLDLWNEALESLDVLRQDAPAAQSPCAVNERVREMTAWVRLD